MANAYQAIDSLDNDHHNVDYATVPSRKRVTWRTAMALIAVASLATGSITWLMMNQISLQSLPIILQAVAPPGTATIGAALCESPNYTKRVLKQAKLEPMASLLARSDGTRKYEASDLFKVKDHFYVVYDNLFGIGRLDVNLPFNSNQNWLVHAEGEIEQGDSGYEALVHDAKDDLFFVVREAVGSDHKDFHSIIDEIKFAANDSSYSLKSSCLSDFKFDSENKGFEGAALVRKSDTLYLLGLCEGNHCAGGAKGREQGNGRVVLLTRYETDNSCGWQEEKILNLPNTVPFTDYSAIDVQREAVNGVHRVAVSSQESSMMWIGTLDSNTWTFHDVAKPRLYHFPRNDNCEVIHCNIEGIHILEDGLVAAVSDKMKSGGRQHPRCLTLDQSIAIFVIPE